MKYCNGRRFSERSDSCAASNGEEIDGEREETKAKFRKYFRGIRHAGVLLLCAGH